MFSCLVPKPNITLSPTDSPLYAGTNISVHCNITLNAAVDGNLSVNITWLRQNIHLSNDTERVTISATSGIIPSFLSILTLTPLTDEDDTTFTCKAQVYSSNSYVINSEVEEMFLLLPVMQRG